MEKLIRIRLDKYLKELTDATHAASMNYEIWWIYKKDRFKYVEIMKDYLGFFSTSIHAHFVAMLVSLCKLYETRSDTINFVTLVRLLRENSVDDIDINKIENLLRQKNKLIKKIGMLRGNYYTHISEKWDYDVLLKKVNIKYDNFKELIESSYSLLNEIRFVSPAKYSRDDTYCLLTTLLESDKKLLKSFK